MLFEGCQGNRGVEIQEKICPGCGAAVELMSSDVFTECEICGTTVYSDLMECVQRCPKAKQCVGEAYFARVMEAKEKWAADMAKHTDDDQW